ncbi:MAG TPA: carbonic anhydrase [Blastocatellia bacterium]|nr:carbonic anhydrase [Blastocatellia bacterium]
MNSHKFRAFLATMFVFTLCLPAALSQQQQYPEPHTQTEESNRNMKPEHALALLQAGNERFVRGTIMTRPIRQQFRETARGQYPFACILNCQDSRTSSELLFDLNNGDSFTIKIAGNIVNPDIQGGLEFGIGPHYAKLIAVIGHTDCGAVKGTIDNKRAIDAGQRGNLIDLLRRIRPALDRVDPSIEPKTSKNPVYVNAVASENVLLVMEEIRKNPNIREKIESGAINLIGGMHDLNTGEVKFFKDKPVR